MSIKLANSPSEKSLIIPVNPLVKRSAALLSRANPPFWRQNVAFTLFAPDTTNTAEALAAAYNFRRAFRKCAPKIRLVESHVRV